MVRAPRLMAPRRILRRSVSSISFGFSCRTLWSMAWAGRNIDCDGVRIATSPSPVVVVTGIGRQCRPRMIVNHWAAGDHRDERLRYDKRQQDMNGNERHDH